MHSDGMWYCIIVFRSHTRVWVCACVDRNYCIWKPMVTHSSLRSNGYNVLRLTIRCHLDVPREQCNRCWTLNKTWAKWNDNHRKGNYINVHASMYECLFGNRQTYHVAACCCVLSSKIHSCNSCVAATWFDVFGSLKSALTLDDGCQPIISEYTTMFSRRLSIVARLDRVVCLLYRYIVYVIVCKCVSFARSIPVESCGYSNKRNSRSHEIVCAISHRHIARIQLLLLLLLCLQYVLYTIISALRITYGSECAATRQHTFTKGTSCNINKLAKLLVSIPSVSCSKLQAMCQASNFGWVSNCNENIFVVTIFARKRWKVKTNGSRSSRTNDNDNDNDSEYAINAGICEYVNCDVAAGALALWIDDDIDKPSANTYQYIPTILTQLLLAHQPLFVIFV